MRVMACSRDNCSNILCDTYKGGIGYVCDECIREFKDLIGSDKLPLSEMDEKLQKLVNLLEKAGVRKHTCINNFGYSQLERDIVDLFQDKLYTKEEVIFNLNKYLIDYEQFKKDSYYGPNQKEIKEWSDNWINKNL